MSRKYNKLNTNDGYDNGDGGDKAVNDRDGAQASNNPSCGRKRCPYASFPSRSLPKVRFLRVLASLNVGSQICLYGVKVFDEAVSVAPGMVGPCRTYGR
jgi:hypothetical protein